MGDMDGDDPQRQALERDGGQIVFPDPIMEPVDSHAHEPKTSSG